MHRAELSRRLAVGFVPLALIALAISCTALAKEGGQFKTPKSYAAFGNASAQEPAPLHTDLGVMGEVEVIRERYPDGAIRIERQTTLDRDGNYVNHGTWKMFTPKADVLAEGQFHFGQRVGLWTRWHGQNDSAVFGEFPFNQFKPPFMSQVTFSDGVMDGEWIITDASDRKCSQISLKMGQRHGMAITWLPNGKTFRQATYDQAKPVGDLLEANEKTGELERVATYVDGRKLVNRTNYHPGTRQKKTEIIHLAAETIQEAGDEFWNVRLAKYSTKGKDLRHGSAKAWFADGKQEFEGFYQYGQKAGMFTFWHQNGQVASTGEYKEDRAEGQWVWWHANGQKSAIGRYEGGVLIGEWRWWDEAGKLTKLRVYDGTESVQSQADDSLKVSEVPSEATVR